MSPVQSSYSERMAPPSPGSLEGSDFDTTTGVCEMQAVAAVGTLTASAIANADTVTIGGKVYTFQDVLTNVDGNVKRSGVLATDLANLAKAINLGGIAGTDYATLMTLNASVSATSTATTLVVTAKTAGTVGNAITTTETSATAAWGGGVLAGGLDAGVIPFGRAVSQGASSDKGVILGGSLAGFRGVSIKDDALRAEQDQYAPRNNIGIVHRGLVWVEPTEAVNANDPVWFNVTTGLFNKSTGVGPLKGARYQTSCGLGGRAMVQVAGYNLNT